MTCQRPIIPPNGTRCGRDVTCRELSCYPGAGIPHTAPEGLVGHTMLCSPGELFFASGPSLFTSRKSIFQPKKQPRRAKSSLLKKEEPFRKEPAPSPVCTHRGAPGHGQDVMNAAGGTSFPSFSISFSVSEPLYNLTPSYNG